MFDKIKTWFKPDLSDEELQKKLEKVRKQTPVPVFWLYGKTQSGKTSLIKFLTGADEAEIGQGFKPCTRYSRQYLFPTPEAPLLTFLDTRGVDEPGYDPAEDLARFNAQAHVVVITVKVMDHALENLLRHFEAIRRASPTRPVVLALTCLHEAYPQSQHPQPYPFATSNFDLANPSIPEALRLSLAEQQKRFAGLYDYLVPIDLTQAIDGFAEPHYGGERLRGVLLEALPAAYRQTLIALEQASKELQDLFAKRALPHILGYSSLAASAGAIPVPWVDLLILPGIQTQMIYRLARLYGQPLSGQRFLELASTLGMGMVVRQAVREVVKFIPFVGSVAGAALAGAATFALGKSFCYYYSAVCKGHVPKADDLKRYYQEQLDLAGQLWKKGA
jgi:uncharacterized protein (DUF697 family)/predicted GTPase